MKELKGLESPQLRRPSVRSTPSKVCGLHSVSSGWSVKWGHSAFPMGSAGHLTAIAKLKRYPVPHLMHISLESGGRYHPQKEVLEWGVCRQLLGLSHAEHTQVLALRLRNSPRSPPAPSWSLLRPRMCPSTVQTSNTTAWLRLWGSYTSEPSTLLHVWLLSSVGTFARFVPGVCRAWFVYFSGCTDVYCTTPDVCVCSAEDGGLGFQFGDVMSKLAVGIPVRVLQ